VRRLNRGNRPQAHKEELENDVGSQSKKGGIGCILRSDFCLGADLRGENCQNTKQAAMVLLS